MAMDRRKKLTVEVPGQPGLYLLPAGVPPGWEVVGTVAAAGMVGALLRNGATGRYARCNAGAIASLNQSQVVAALERLQATLGRTKIDGILADEMGYMTFSPADRFFHAADRTWWRKDGHGGLVRADPPEGWFDPRAMPDFPVDHSAAGGDEK